MTQNLALAPNAWNSGKRECKIIIETPKGRRNKFRYNQEYGLFELAFLLPAGLVFPYDFGFIPSTLGEDGDPLDVLVLMDEPAHVGCLMDVRLIGVIEAQQTEEGKTNQNDRLLGVALNSFSQEGVTDLEQVSTTVLSQIEDFFATYNKSRGKRFTPKGRRGPDRAAELVAQGIRNRQR